MTITRKVWSKYIANLRKINEEAARLADQYLTTHEVLTPEGTDALIEYCYGLAVKYGEAASELAAQMYDALAAAQGVSVPPAVPAEVATYGDVANTVLGIQKRTQNAELLRGRLDFVYPRSAAVDLPSKLTATELKNALRDGAEWAWIPVGDTCAFCLTLASNGWQRASKQAIKNGHAEHIHANCDCTYAIRFDDSEVEGYDPKEYRDMYYGASDGSPRDKINAMRREAYARNREEINAQKRSAYERRKELNSSAAEEINVD